MTKHEETAKSFMSALWGKGLYTMKTAWDKTEVLSSKDYWTSDEKIHLRILCGQNKCTFDISGRKLIIYPK